MNKTEEMKEFFNECITKDLINSEDLAINYMKVAKDYIEQLESAKDIKEALELANMSVKDFVYFKHRAEELEAKEQKLIEKLEKDIEMLEDVLDLCKTDGKVAKYKIENLKEEIADFKEILKILKGEKE